MIQVKIFQNNVPTQSRTTNFIGGSSNVTNKKQDTYDSKFVECLAFLYDSTKIICSLSFTSANVVPSVDAINSISPDKSDEDDQECMGCKKDDPVLEMDLIVFLDNGITFKYSQTRCR